MKRNQPNDKHSVELVYADTPQNRGLLQRLERLSKPFAPTPWLFNEHLQLVWLGLKKTFAPAMQYDKVQDVRAADGGLTQLHWLGLDLPLATPTLVVLHTISGSHHSMRGLVRDLHQLTGWRVVVCQRRGHGGQPLGAKRFNTMGDVDDLDAQLKRIQQMVPGSPLYAVGVSAGTGLLIRHLGEKQYETPFKAAYAYCPGYDIRTAFQRARPFYSAGMTKKLLKTFILPNASTFRAFESYTKLVAARDLEMFHRHLYQCAGYESYDAFIAACNPVNVMDQVKIPVLILNAEDDPVCVAENVDEHKADIAKLPSVILAVTRKGSHCAHYAGWSATPWAHHLAAEYFQAQHALSQTSV